MSDEATEGGAPAAPPEPEKRWSWGGCLLLLLILGGIAVAALTTAGSRVDRLLGEVKSTLDEVPNSSPPDRGTTGREAGDPGAGGDTYDPTNPDSGQGTSGFDDPQGIR